MKRTTARARVEGRLVRQVPAEAVDLGQQAALVCPYPTARCVSDARDPAREGAFFLTVTFALYCFGKNASGTMHTVWVPTFQKRHQGVRKHSAKEHRRKSDSTE